MKQYFTEKNERGSATIEAIVAFVGFLFTIFTILGLVNFCRAQMLVSSAVDSAARELSQYAYFYKMSGLQKFDEKLSGNADVGKNNINDIIGTVDALYSSAAGAVERTGEDMANLANVTSKGDLQLQDIETVITNIDTNGTNILTSITSMSNALERIGDDPLLYMRSLVAIAGQEGMGLAKRAIAASLAKLFVQKHFGNTRSEADQCLESIGIEGGLSSMNFNMSTMFTDEKMEDIEIVVFYKVKLLQVLDWELLETNISKRACCKAWLGGDNVQTYVKNVATSSAPNSGSSSNGGAEPTNPEEEIATSEIEMGNESTSSSVDTTDSYWYLGVDENYWDEQLAAFDDLLCETYGIDREATVVNGVLYGRDENGVAYGMDYCLTADDVFSNEIFLDSMEAIFSQEEAYRGSNGEYGYEPGSTTAYVYVIYVPENISDEEYQAIMAAAREMQEYYAAYAKEKYGIDIPVTVDVVRAGGNYDYENASNEGNGGD